MAVVPDLLFNLFIHLWVQVVKMIGFRISFDELMVYKPGSPALPGVGGSLRHFATLFGYDLIVFPSF